MSSTMKNIMQNQTTQAEIEGNRVVNVKQKTSKEGSIQTDLCGDEVEKLREFYDKYLEKQLKLDVTLRHVEETFASDLSQSNEKIAKLSSEISLLQSKLNDEIASSEKALAHRVDLKVEEIRGEMQFLKGVIEETKNHNLIDNMHKKLAQTNKKINDVKRKCMDATRHCLQIQFENLLMNSTPESSKTDEIGHELGIIKSNFGREIAALKNAVSGDVSKIHRFDMNSSTSSTSTSSTPIRKALDESIKSATKWNEKSPEISFDDKFSTIIDDEKEARSEQDQEINSIASRLYSDFVMMPQDESFN